MRDRQIAMDTPLVVSARAHAMPPSKMGFPVGTQGHARQRPQDADGPIRERYRDHRRGGHRRLGRSLRRRHEPSRRPARPARIAFRQSEWSAGGRPCLVGPRHGDHRPGALRAVSRPGEPVRPWRAVAGQRDHRQPQQSARPLPRRRRHEDGLHLCGGFQRRGERLSRWPSAPDRRLRSPVRRDADRQGCGALRSWFRRHRSTDRVDRRPPRHPGLPRRPTCTTRSAATVRP